jgi:hypothetical protein
MKNYLNEIPFPVCAEKCVVLKYFGVGECESRCPVKFDEWGNPIELKGEPDDKQSGGDSIK